MSVNNQERFEKKCVECHVNNVQTFGDLCETCFTRLSREVPGPCVVCGIGSRQAYSFVCFECETTRFDECREAISRMMQAARNKESV